MARGDADPGPGVGARWAFRLKWRPPYRAVLATLDVARPRARFQPDGPDGEVEIFDGAADQASTEVSIEDGSGAVLARRADPRRRFPGGRRLLWWDRLDQIYFGGYALWNYLTFPALLLRDDIEWSEPSPGALEARFPPSLPTHCPVQQFHMDPDTGLLRQHDYTAEVFGGWARAANVVLAHDTADGVPYASRRRVTPRRSDGTPRKGPLLVGIQLDAFALIAD